MYLIMRYIKEKQNNKFQSVYYVHSYKSEQIQHIQLLNYIE